MPALLLVAVSAPFVYFLTRAGGAELGATRLMRALALVLGCGRHSPRSRCLVPSAPGLRPARLARVGTRGRAARSRHDGRAGVEAASRARDDRCSRRSARPRPLWVVVARAGALVARRPRRRASRPASPARCAVAAVGAVVALAASGGFLRGAALGYSEAAPRRPRARRGRAAPRRAARPGARARLRGRRFSAPRPGRSSPSTDVWLAVREPRASPLRSPPSPSPCPRSGSCPELWGSGDLLRSSERARVPNPGAPALAARPALASLGEAARLVPLPLALAALAGVVVAWRRRGRLPLVLAGAAAAWIVPRRRHGRARLLGRASLSPSGGGPDRRPRGSRPRGARRRRPGPAGGGRRRAAPSSSSRSPSGSPPPGATPTDVRVRRGAPPRPRPRGRRGGRRRTRWSRAASSRPGVSASRRSPGTSASTSPTSGWSRAPRESCSGRGSRRGELRAARCPAGLPARRARGHVGDRCGVPGGGAVKRAVALTAVVASGLTVLVLLVGAPAGNVPEDGERASARARGGRPGGARGRPAAPGDPKSLYVAEQTGRVHGRPGRGRTARAVRRPERIASARTASAVSSASPSIRATRGTDRFYAHFTDRRGDTPRHRAADGRNAGHSRERARALLRPAALREPQRRPDRLRRRTDGSCSASATAARRSTPSGGRRTSTSRSGSSSPSTSTGPARSPRSWRTGSAIRGASHWDERRATSSSATSARTPGRRSTSSRPASPGS